MLHVLKYCKIWFIVWPLFVNTASKISGVDNLRACSVVPGVLIVKSDCVSQDSILINHERIHFAQAKELWGVGYALTYIKEIICNRISRKLSSTNAYYANALEQEAYMHQCDMHYIEKRKKFAWRSYLSSKEKKKLIYVDRVLWEVNGTDTVRVIFASQ